MLWARFAASSYSGQQTVTAGVVTTEPVGPPPLGEQLGDPEGVVVACADATPHSWTHWPTVLSPATLVLHAPSLYSAVVTEHVAAPGAPQVQGMQPRSSSAVSQTYGWGNVAGQVAAPDAQTHHRGANGAAGAGVHQVPSAHEMGVAVVPQATPAVAHVGAGKSGTPLAGAHAPTAACEASCTKRESIPGTLVHAPPTSIKV
jgi:hypothetical protein